MEDKNLYYNRNSTSAEKENLSLAEKDKVDEGPQ